MSEFKVGDTVTCIKDGACVRRGQDYKVLYLFDDGVGVRVDDGHGHLYPASYFNKAGEAK